MNEQYRPIYADLEVPPGCTWSELRTAYKQMVQKWHPDRFQGDPEKLRHAEEKIKKINRAYELLAEFYRAHGNLPLAFGHAAIIPPSHGATEGQRPPETPGSPPPSQPAPPHRPASSPTPHVDAAPMPRARTGWFARTVIVGLLLWFGYNAWRDAATTPIDTTTAEMAKRPQDRGTPGSGSAASGTGFSPAPTESIVPHHGPQLGADVGTNSGVRGNRGSFQLGSTVGEVYAAQGKPDRIENDVWHFGRSKIYFRDGRVDHWENDPMNQLNVRDDTAGDRADTPGIAIGTTKAEVRSIQGQPLVEGGSVWEYGLSKVYFQNDRVSGWYDSPLDPLRLRQ
jgi:hypothetical protein